MKRLVKSHFIKSDEPRGVYGYVWEGPFLEVGQLMGNIWNISQDDETGKLEYDHVPVYNNGNYGQCSELDHSFVGYDGIMASDSVWLGHVGETVGLNEVNTLRRLIFNHEDGADHPEKFVQRLEKAGLVSQVKKEIEQGNAEGKFKGMEARVNSHSYYNSVTKDTTYEYFLEVYDELTLFAQLGDGNIKAVTELADEIYGWRKMGVGEMSLSAWPERYGEQIGELMAVAGIVADYYGKDEDLCIDDILYAREIIGCDHCFADDFAAAVRKHRYHSFPQETIDQIIAKGREHGLIFGDGNVIRFSSEVERIAGWKFEIKEG